MSNKDLTPLTAQEFLVALVAFREADDMLERGRRLGFDGDSVAVADVLSDVVAAYAARTFFLSALRGGRADAALVEIAEAIACTGATWGCDDALCPVHGIGSLRPDPPPIDCRPAPPAAPPRVCEGFSAEGFPCRFSAGHAPPCGGVSGDDLENS